MFIYKSVFPHSDKIITPSHPDLIVTEEFHVVNSVRVSFFVIKYLHWLLHAPDIYYLYCVPIVEGHSILVKLQQPVG